MSCTSTKDATTAANTENTETMDDTAQRESTLTNAGFIKATVVDKKGANNCGFVLKTEDNKLYLPVDWLVPEYKVAGKVVYIKYIDSKAPQSGCNEATPIVIQEIKLIR